LSDGSSDPATDEIAIRVNASGATIYMTRRAMKLLVADLNRVLEADPAECFETHIGMLFSSFDADENYRTPHLSFDDGLGQITSDIRWAQLRHEIEAGEMDADVTPAPFEITFMHVSRDAVAEEAAHSDATTPADTANHSRSVRLAPSR
jgi:hypothetical protein